MTAAELAAWLEETWPGVTDSYDIEDLAPRTARVRLRVGGQHLRPGGIVSGPALMALADLAMWAAVLGAVGLKPMSVTVDLNMHFLRPAPAGDVIAEARLHKVGKRRAVGDVLLRTASDPDGDPVAHATLTYAIPPD